MGWWSADIMGGDGPLDAKDEFEEILSSPESYKAYEAKSWDGSILTADSFNNNHDLIREQILSRDNWGSEVDIQVLGVLIMKSGAVMPQDFKDAIIDAAERDEWYIESKKGGVGEDRIKAIEGFIEAVKSYDTDGGCPRVTVKEK